VPNEDSVTAWIDGVASGDEADVRKLWDRYFERLVRLAGSRLAPHSRRSFDEEDVALSAFQSFCDRAGRGRFPRLEGRDDLWRLLATIVVRKAAAAARGEARLKRGGGRVLGESAMRAGADAGEAALARVLSREPTPEEAALFADGCLRSLERLREPSVRSVALRRLEGWSTSEIARSLDVSPRTVERKLELIRAIWSDQERRA
jgi:DNA-directed RNA polymerase specialized sigma24 family protein